MRFIHSMVETAFEARGDGEEVFYPWGPWGAGVLLSRGSAAATRHYLLRWLSGSLGAAALGLLCFAGRLPVWTWIAPASAILVLGVAYMRFVRGLQRERRPRVPRPTRMRERARLEALLGRRWFRFAEISSAASAGIAGLLWIWQPELGWIAALAVGVGGGSFLLLITARPR